MFRLIPRNRLELGRSAKNSARKKALPEETRAFFIFSRAIFRASPQLTERLREAKSKGARELIGNCVRGGKRERRKAGFLRSQKK